MTRERFDLHTHSTASGGAMPPREVVALAAERGLAGVALTDHDSVDGLAEAVGMGQVLGIRCIPGVEITAASSLDGSDVHVLGYFIDPAAQQLQALLACSRETNDSGVRTPVTVADAIATIHQAGGAAVIAHPGAPNVEDGLGDDVIRHAASVGLDGLEVDHPAHDGVVVERSAQLAVELGLVQTAGSDDRGDGPDGSRLGCRTVAARIVDALEQRAELHRSRAAARGQ